jgi:TetR/AcrR family transcriptional repressor of mexJK operon
MSPEPRPPEPRPEDRRRPGRPSLSNEALLDVALDLFLDQGFDRTSIEAICAHAGMAKRTVYARYGDKDSLFKAALQRAIQEWIVPVERLRAAEVDDLEACLIAVGEILLGNIMNPTGQRLLRLTNAESGRSPEIGQANVRQGTDPHIAYLAELFARRLGSKLAPLDAKEAAEGFLHLVTGPAVDAAWGVRRDEAALARHIRASVRLFLHGASGGGAGDAGLVEENRRLRALLAETAAVLEGLRGRLQGDTA